MPSNSDELRAHRFATRRLRTVIVAGRADADTGVAGRSGAAWAGVVVGLASLAAVAVVALVAPAAADWRRSDAVIVERETGARYVYLDGQLHPVPNYTSARLIIGAADAPVIEATRHQLAGAARGRPLGIVGAPDSLPATTDLLTGGWAVCSASSASPPGVSSSGAVPAGTSSSGAVPAGVLSPGVVPAGGVAGPVGVVLAGAAPGGAPLGDRAILGRVAHDDYLIWHGRRLRVRHPSVVLTALGLIGDTPTPLAAALIDALPAGADLDEIRVPDRGARSTVNGLRVGAVVTPGAEAGVDAFAVVVPGGLAVISALQAAILLNDPATPGSGAAVEIAKPSFASAKHPELPAPAGWPAAPPTVAAVDRGACVAIGADGTTGAVTSIAVDGASVAGGSTVGASTAGALSAGVATGGTSAAGTGPLVVVVPPGRGALVRAATAPGIEAGAVCLLTDAGVCYPVADAVALTSLGYAAVAPVVLPAGVAALLPRGVTLSRDAATK